MTGGRDRFLCICADDFGMSEGINAAVLELLAQGRICAASCMVLRGAWASGAGALRGIDPATADLGLHLELECPPSEAPLRSGAGHGSPRRRPSSEPPLPSLLAASYLGLLRPGAVRAGIRDQLARFEDAMGRPPAFVDGHRHVHQLPVVREVLVEEIVSRYGIAAPWLRSTAPAVPRALLPSKADLVFALGGRRLLSLAAAHGVPTSRALLGLYGFDGDARTHRMRLAQWIGACRSGDVLLCHPARDLAPEVPHGAARLREYEALGALAFPIRAEGGNIVLRPLSRQPWMTAGDA